MARIGAFDLEFGLDATRPSAEHDDTGSEKHRLLDIMGHENRRETLPAPQGDQLLLQRQPRQRIELAERLIKQQQGRIVDERAGKRGALSHAARELMRISPAEVSKADQIERRIDARALLLEDAPSIEPGRDIVPDRRSRKERRILKDENTRRIGPVDQRPFS